MGGHGGGSNGRGGGLLTWHESMASEVTLDMCKCAVFESQTHGRVFQTRERSPISHLALPEVAVPGVGSEVAHYVDAAGSASVSLQMYCVAKATYYIWYYIWYCIWYCVVRRCGMRADQRLALQEVALPGAGDDVAQFLDAAEAFVNNK